MASKSGAESDGKRLRKNWSDDSMLAAMEAVRTSKMSISVAANRFKVPWMISCAAWNSSWSVYSAFVRKKRFVVLVDRAN